MTAPWVAPTIQGRMRNATRGHVAAEAAVCLIAGLVRWLPSDGAGAYGRGVGEAWERRRLWDRNTTTAS